MNENKLSNENGIELSDLIKKIRSQITIIYKCLIIALLIGIIIIILSPRQYKTEISLLAETTSKSSSGGFLGQLGNLSGVNIGNLLGMDLGFAMGKEAITPDLYPEIVYSSIFLIDILKSDVYYDKLNKNITVSNYLDHYTKPSIAGIPFYIIGLLRSKDHVTFDDVLKNEPLKLTKNQSDIIDALADLINIKIIESGGGITGGENKIIVVSVEAQNPLISSLLAQLVVENLKLYVINYNTNKIKKDLEFIEARYDEAKEKYNQTQAALADFEDSNINVILESVKTKRKKLETENNLAANIYKSLAQTLEQTRILVQDKTPVFSTIEPAKVPIKKSKPKRLLIMISILFLGIFFGLTFIFYKELIKR